MRIDDRSTPAGPVGPAPLAALLVVTALNSFGTGMVQNGIFFLTREAYGWDRTQNYQLAVALGVTYIVGAAGAGPAVARITAATGLSSRALLAWIVAIMSVLCVLPALALRVGFEGAWPVWVLIGVYSPLSGVLWPMVESFVSGGRRGDGLRRTIGLWNVVWSAAVFLSYWAMAPLIKPFPLEALAGLGALQLLSVGFVIAFPREPGSHDDGGHRPHPPVYVDLLTTFRLLLPMSYFVLSALGPYLPEALARLGVDASWATLVASVWLGARVVTFRVMGRSEGWHGRWSPAILGGGMLLVGFALCVLAPRWSAWMGVSVEPGRIDVVGLATLIAGLGVFGTGMATVYTAALYYAMEVGNAQVSAGGTHETLIGVGYTVGPALGLGASLAIRSGQVPETRFEPLVLTGVGLVAVLVCGEVVRRVRQNHRRPRPG
jgi:hypothetical protein